MRCSRKIGPGYQAEHIILGAPTRNPDAPKILIPHSCGNLYGNIPRFLNQAESMNVSGSAFAARFAGFFPEDRC